MRSRLLLLLALIALPASSLLAQTRRGVRFVAVIVSIHADSSGRAVESGRVLDSARVDSVVASLRKQTGGTIWFSWSGGPAHRRTAGQEALLERLRASGVRVELRTDSTLRSRIVRP